jgi:hypothetical protein
VTTQDKKKECLLAGVLSKEGYKILHLDRNAYYGAEKESSQKSLFINFNSELLLCCCCCYKYICFCRKDRCVCDALLWRSHHRRRRRYY